MYLLTFHHTGKAIVTSAYINDSLNIVIMALAIKPEDFALGVIKSHCGTCRKPQTEDV